MGTDLAITNLWAELATWRPAAAEVIARPQYWAVHGATRMGKALTIDDRIGDDEVDARCIEAGVERARSFVELLMRADGSSSSFQEPAPPLTTTRADAARAIEAVRIADVAPDAIERLDGIAHAMQAGAKLGKTASHGDVRAALSSRPRAARRPGGPFAALLVMSPGTLWLPIELRTAWDSPACVVASSVQLAADLAALPDCLRDGDPETAGDLAAVGVLVKALEAALERGGRTRCIRMSG